MDSLDKYVREVSIKFHNKIEELTREQFEDAIHGAIKAGDFLACCDQSVFVENVLSQKRGLVYIPYREHIELKFKICDLEKVLRDNNIEYPLKAEKE